MTQHRKFVSLGNTNCLQIFPNTTNIPSFASCGKYHNKNTYQLHHWFFTWGDYNDGLTHSGRVTHICIINLTIIGSDNGLSPGRHLAVIWTNARIFLIGPLGTNFIEIIFEIQTLSFKKKYLNLSSAKYRPCCLGLNELKQDCCTSMEIAQYYTSHRCDSYCQNNWMYYPSRSTPYFILPEMEAHKWQPHSDQP